MRFPRRILAFPVVAATLLVSAGGASAAPAEVIRFGFGGGGSITGCANEQITLIDGTYQLLDHTNVNGSEFIHWSVRGTGIGDQGHVYVFEENGWNKVSTDGDQFVQDQLRMISKGSAPDLLVSFRFIAFANGDFQVTTDKTVCTG